MPLFSVVTPCYNSEKWIARCIESVVIGNDGVDFEMIIINDGSTDRTLEICQKYAENYNQIRLYSRENRGYCSTMNELISLCTGDYVVSVDSDNWLSEGSLVMLQAALREYGLVDFVQFPVLCFGNEDQAMPLYKTTSMDVYVEDRFALEEHIKNGDVYLESHGGKAISRSLLLSTPLFRGNPCGADTRLMRLLSWKTKRCLLLAKPYLGFGQRADSLTGTVQRSLGFYFDYLKCELDNMSYFESAIDKQTLPSEELAGLLDQYITLLAKGDLSASELRLLGKRMWAHHHLYCKKGLVEKAKMSILCHCPIITKKVWF